MARGLMTLHLLPWMPHFTKLRRMSRPLFYLFNNLPSPVPDPEVVDCEFSRESMYDIFEGKVKGITTRTYDYQRRTAGMMLQREAQPAQIMDPRLTKIVDQKGTPWYIDHSSGTCLREPRTYESTRGGICAETMGLGKTLICLTLILATRDLPSAIPPEYSYTSFPVRRKTGSLVEMAASSINPKRYSVEERLCQLEASRLCFLKMLGGT